ncbi:MAG TPA: transglutaminase family protein [Solirubrobacteraceae bacterium]|jgi:transglutaminase-like putative cysteine protease|nr:transglutaminase family protein [Solirubrobacteraceae bacterium]
MNFAIRYLTEYRYAAPVTDNLNALRVQPATTPNQRCDDFNLLIDPETRLGRHVDYFGTEVIEFGVSRPHSKLTIDARARVVTSTPPEPPSAPWSGLESTAYRDVGGEFLLGVGASATDEKLVELGEKMRAGTPSESVVLLTELIPAEFEYRAGVTYVGSSVQDLIAAGAGVCQDFVHLALILLRRQGIAARYVSGYLFVAPAEGADSVEVDTHAWLEALLPADGAPVWVGFDPTNSSPAGEGHVKIGHGRHYPDVPPIKGVFRGGSAELETSVVMTQLDPTTTASAAIVAP